VYCLRRFDYSIRVVAEIPQITFCGRSIPTQPIASKQIKPKSPRNLEFGYNDFIISLALCNKAPYNHAHDHENSNGVNRKAVDVEAGFSFRA
jgi:hypothetical protein